MNSRFKLILHSLSKRFGLFISISIGLFLFILFFQPFPLEKFDFDNQLLFNAGFGAIVFIIILLDTVVFSWIINRNQPNGNENIISSYLRGIFILAFCSVAFAFYLRYVGHVNITFFIMFKVVLLCLVPPVILKLYDKNDRLIQKIGSLISERKLIQKRIDEFEEDSLNKSIEFISDTNNENLVLLVSEIIFIQSADNYIEVVYFDGESVRKKLVRNTLKNIELQIRPYPNFIRCHRTCIVNMLYIERLIQDYGNHWIKIKGYDGKIPVSRQYLLKIREAL